MWLRLRLYVLVNLCRRPLGLLRHPFTQRCLQIVHGQRLGEIIVHAGGNAALGFALQGVRRDGDDRRAPAAGFFVGAHRGRQFKAVHVGHVAIGQQQGVVALTPGLERQLAVVRHLAGITEFGQLAADDLLVGHVVFGQQDQRAPGPRLVDRQSDDVRCRAVVDIGFDQRRGPSGGNGDGVDQLRLTHRIAVEGDAVRPFDAGAAALAARQQHKRQAVSGQALDRLLLALGVQIEVENDDIVARRIQGRPVQAGRSRRFVGDDLDLRRPVVQILFDGETEGRNLGRRQHAQAGEVDVDLAGAAFPAQRHRQFNGEGRARADFTGHGDLAAHQVGQVLADRQTQPGAAETPRRRAFGLGKSAEQFFLGFGRYADALIDHRKPQPQIAALARHRIGPHDDLALFREFHRVAGQVKDDLAQANRVAQHGRRNFRIDVGENAHTLARGVGRHRRRCPLDDIDDRGRHAFDIELAGFDFGKIENVVDDGEQRITRIAHRIQHQALLVIQFGLREQIGHADDAVHRRADFVAHRGQEIGLGLGRRFGLIARHPELRLGFLALGYVFLDAEEIGDLASLIGQRGERNVLPIRLAGLLLVVEFAVPDPAAFDGVPQFLELLGLQETGFQNAEGIAQDIFRAIAANSGKRRVDVFYIAVRIGNDD